MFKRLRLKQIITSILLAVIAFASLFSGYCHGSNNGLDYSTAEMLSVIDDIILWKKNDMTIDKQDNLLSVNFLQAAGTTAGDWYPVGIGRIGYPDDYDAYLAIITDQVCRRYKTEEKLDSTKATEWHRIGLAILSMGGDPRKVGVDEIDLVADGTYNRGEITSLGTQGINGWVWGLIFLDSMRYVVPEDSYYSREDIIVKILECQLEDGGFALFNGPADPDITAMTIQALAPYYNCEQIYTYKKIYSQEQVTKTVRQVIDESLDVLSKTQLEDGDFSSWESENSESTSQVIVALCSLGIDVTSDQRFIKDDNNLIDGLFKYRMEDGGFVHSKMYSEENPTSLPDQSNSMASEQVLYSLVAYCRYREGQRSLYDFREDIDPSVKKQIDLVMESIDNLPNQITTKDKENVEKIFREYMKIPIYERSYVYNYYKLSDAMKTLNISNTSEPIVANIGINENGYGHIPTIFYLENKEETGEFTEFYVDKVKALPEKLTTEYYVEVLKLIKKLENAENKDQYPEIMEQLQNKKKEIEEIEQEIESLNQEILAKLYPFSELSIRDKNSIDEIVKRFEKLDKDDQKKVMCYEDVIKSKTKVDNQIRAAKLTFIMVVVSGITLYIVNIRMKKRKKHKSYQNMELFDEDIV